MIAVTQGLDQRLDGSRVARRTQGFHCSQADVLIAVTQGLDDDPERVRITGLGESLEIYHFPTNPGGPHRFSKIIERGRGGHAVFFKVVSPQFDQRLDGALVTQLSQGARGGSAEFSIAVSQHLDQRLDSARVPPLSQDRRRRPSKKGIMLLQRLDLVHHLVGRLKQPVVDACGSDGDVHLVSQEREVQTLARLILSGIQVPQLLDEVLDDLHIVAFHVRGKGPD